MAMPRGAVLLLFLLLVAAEMGAINAKMGVGKQLEEKVEEEEKEKEDESKGKKEGPRCITESLLFKGLCFDSKQCSEVCLKENFLSGECKAKMAVPKCFCKKPC